MSLADGVPLVGSSAEAAARLACMLFGGAAPHAESSDDVCAEVAAVTDGGPSLFGAARPSAGRRLGAALSRAVSGPPILNKSRTVLMIDVWSKGVVEPAALGAGRILDPGAT